MAAPLLSATGLRRDFGGLRAVDLDLEVAEGELRCLIGPNGAGKSTLFRMLAGVLRPTLGSIRFRGREIGGLDAFRIATLGISIKFQVPSVFENLTVLDNLQLAAERPFGYAGGRARALAMLERIGFSALGGQPVSSLSHGQKQRLDVAMAAVPEPTLLLLDEPTAGVSPQEVERTATLVLDLARHASVLVVEHNMDFVRQIARRVTVLHEGRVFADGAMTDIEADAGVRDIYLGRRRRLRAEGG